MQLSLRVHSPEGAYEITTNLFTVVLWERKFKRKASDMASAMGVEDLAYLAYEASKQNGKTVPAAFDDFIKKLSAPYVEVIEQEQENPTPAAPTDDN
jgi:uncharacterized membrane protein YebE (DUF533 family)